MYTLFDYNAEKLPILKYCGCIICVASLLSCFPSYNIAEAYFILLLSCDVPNLEALLMYTLFDYNAKKLPILKYCCCIIYLVILLSCFPSYNNAEAYFIFLLCCDVPNLETLLTYTLTCYIAELFPILKHC